MNRMIKSSLLLLLVSNGALASEYLLNNNNISISFDDTNSAVLIKDKLSQSKLAPKELFFLTLPNEDVIHAADFKNQKCQPKR